MDLNQLKSFVAVAHQGNLTHAAETLCLSQPAVSAQIKAIEKNLDIVLFERNAQGMTLTRSGEAFLPHAEALLQHMHQLDRFASSLSEQYANQIELGLIYPLPGHKIAALTQDIFRQHPHVKLNYHHGLSGHLINQIRKKELHGGFFLGNNPYRSVRCIFLESIDYVLICANEFSADLESNLPKSLNNYPWIEMSEASGSRRQGTKLWHDYRLNPPRSVICDQQATIIDLVAAQIGIALVPLHDAEDGIAQGKNIHILDFPKQQIELGFIYANEYEHDPLVGILKDSIEKVWA
ncbi:LysR family transcriptional regulator [Stenoxybacter acetivorans]|uniref:LysR family transcriptional regulator n=1 Tax=Stenoxybacter acetivorans TaxID=422441 RepID=UPI00055B2E19|nr:LysR family transcriptional regulator [Stenoxybacter acetivorans]